MLINISAPLAEIDSESCSYFFSCKTHWKTPVREIFLINLQAFSLKETPTRPFSSGFLQILKEHAYLKNHSP